MSKMTMRKRISLTVVTALTTGVLTSVTTGPAANAHGTVIAVAQANVNAIGVGGGTPNNSMFTAVNLSDTGAAIVGNGSNALVHEKARSLGLLSKDASSGTAQTATALTGAQLSLYASVATDVAFVASGGSFSVSSGQAATGGTATFDQTRKTLFLDISGTTATGAATVWVAPSTAGTYTISMYNGASGLVNLDTPARTLGASMTVTVVAASAGGSYNAGNSFCAISNSAASFSVATNVDGTASTVNGGSMYINFALKDAYNNALDSGNIVVSATGGGFVAYANGSVTTAGTGATVVAYDGGSGDSVRVTQGTADTPTSSTVTISYNGTTVCTKTVGFAGAPSKMTVTVSQTQDLNASTGKTDFLKDGYGRAGLFTVLLTDAAGNQVQAAAGDAASGSLPAIGTFSSNSASLAGQTIVSALSVDNPATQTSSTLPGRLSTGIYTCGATAGSVTTAKLDFTITATGKTITSDAFTLRCADDPYSYTASFDKASYVQGDLAVLTVSFLDSKGNAANSVTSTGGWTGNMPMLTNVTTTGAAASLGTTGTAKYTYTVGTPSGMTAGTYTSIVDFTTLTAAKTAVVATPTYKLSTGGDTTTNADVLKSIVALIASINKQIQALQKLILKR